MEKGRKESVLPLAASPSIASSSSSLLAPKATRPPSIKGEPGSACIAVASEEEGAEWLSELGWLEEGWTREGGERLAELRRVCERARREL